MLWGDFPWEEPPKKLGKLLSWGALARNLTRSLGMIGTVVPYMPRAARLRPEAHREVSESFLRSVDVLWADLYPGSAAALELRHELDLPCRAILYGGGTLPKGAEAMQFPWRGLLRPGDELVLTCEADREIWRRLVERSNLREWVVPCPVDDTVFRPRPSSERAAIRARRGLPVDAPLLLYVGRLNVQKNLHSLLRLLAAVCLEVPSARLCLVGEEDDVVLGEFGVRNTGYAEYLCSLAAELGVADAVVFLGPQFGGDLAELYSAADVVVNLSFYHRENFGMSQAEAQMCGVPVVCSAWGGFKDVVRHGETGYLVDTVLTKQGVRVDWAAGARHAVELLRDPALRAGMGARAAERARELFSIGAVAGSLQSVLAGDRRLDGPASGNPDSLPAYEPSKFARRYEEHKRDCGWYAPDAEVAWYPPMFGGRDYELYETLMEPYARRLATDLSPVEIAPDWVPYFPSAVRIDPVRLVAQDLDPVWPHWRFLRRVEWEVLRRVDGATSVAEITETAAADLPDVDPMVVAAVLWQLHVEGFLLFLRDRG